METAIIITSVLLILFSILALYDGFYLHIFKYKLHNHPESKTEHYIHTIRAIFFPAILYFLFLSQSCSLSFIIGLVVVALDLLVLALDAYTEKDSREFMGGLPRWEYILHLFVNGFHFASIAVFLSIKLQFENNQIIILPTIENQNYELLHTILINLLPGSVLVGLLHFFLCFSKTSIFWNNLTSRK
ncbi:hypothetical protein [Flavobacterium saccharophilum]|jgi:hypothetical protein|uniref:Uncharacterized protein n=1 Tax=Flavobacterium saccharophilum TaxID=29534 RepID=A0A1M7HXF8_9FLAO|nr:hypothetical protein [Flavobacterium saccharophilum]SHM33174.1 hypothetical protein SAMN05444366_2917 [Flavobacterium saccharophilum]